MDDKTKQLLTELAVVLPQFANELPEDIGNALMTWVDRIEESLEGQKPDSERQKEFLRNPQGLG